MWHCGQHFFSLPPRSRCVTPHANECLHFLYYMTLIEWQTSQAPIHDKYAGEGFKLLNIETIQNQYWKLLCELVKNGFDMMHGATGTRALA